MLEFRSNLIMTVLVEWMSHHCIGLMLAELILGKLLSAQVDHGTAYRYQSWEDQL